RLRRSHRGHRQGHPALRRARIPGGNARHGRRRRGSRRRAAEGHAVVGYDRQGPQEHRGALRTGGPDRRTRRRLARRWFDALAATGACGRDRHHRLYRPEGTLRAQRERRRQTRRRRERRPIHHRQARLASSVHDMDATALGLPVLVALIAVALLFDFLNGLHDAANSIATVVATRVLRPQTAVLWAAFFNFIAFAVFGLHVATTVGTGIVSAGVVDGRVIFAPPTGTHVWDILT